MPPSKRRRANSEPGHPAAAVRLLAGEDFPRPPAQKRSVEKRERLKLAALDVFAEKGYEQAAIEEIARRAGLAVGGFYQHYRSKRQLLLALMNELLETLGRLELPPHLAGGVQSGLRAFLAAAFARDLKYLGAYRAWREAVLSDRDLAARDARIHAWTTARVARFLTALARLPGARKDLKIPALAKVLDSFFWNLLAQAIHLKRRELNDWVDASARLVYHAMME